MIKLIPRQSKKFLKRKERQRETETERQVHRPSQRTKNLWNMKVTVIPISIGALGTIPEGLVSGVVKELEIGGRAGTIQNTVLLRSVRILRRVLET